MLWESNRMFLPEHKQALMDRKQQKTKFHKPELDENQFELVNQIISESIKNDRSIRITYACEYGTEQFWGWITKINHHERWLKMINDEDHLILKFERILDVE
ncbi:YolD-like family protein [Bacillus sp. PS06]|nr:YolD-like family protein [Bacillus sp. PS06]